MAAIQPVVQYGQAGRVLGLYGGVQDEIVAHGLAEARIANRYGWWRNMALVAAKRLCQGLWFYQYRQGTLDPAMIMYLNMLTEQLLASFSGYASLVERIWEGVEPARVLLRLLDERPAIDDAPDARPVEVPARAGLRMVNVRFGYGRGDVLRDFDLTIEEGRILGIAGRSGCGKTTIHNLLCRMYDVEQGQRRGVWARCAPVAARTVARPVRARLAERRRVLFGDHHHGHRAVRTPRGDV